MRAIVTPMLDELRIIVETAEQHRGARARAEHMLQGQPAASWRSTVEWPPCWPSIPGCWRCCGRSSPNDFTGLVDDILQLLPQTRQVFMVMGSGPLGQFWRRELEERFGRFRDRLTFVWSDDLSLPEILRRCASLPRDSAIFYLTFGTDAQGGAYADERVLADLHATANAPLFGSAEPLLRLWSRRRNDDVH